jgi:hypothetical protein
MDARGQYESKKMRIACFLSEIPYTLIKNYPGRVMGTLRLLCEKSEAPEVLIHGLSKGIA